MTVPLMILAVGALVLGWLVGPATHWFEHTLSGLKDTYPSAVGYPKVEEPDINVSLVMILSTVVAVGGIGIAWLMYVKSVDLPGKVAASIRTLYLASLNKFYIDELYDALIVKPLQGFADFCRIIDQQVVDGLVDTVGELPRLFGALFRPVQNGLVQFYALAMMLGLTVFLIALARGL
jgi:NADH-quinone oxidoreductase subunit L